MAVMENDLATIQSHRAKREQEASVGSTLIGATPSTNLLQQSQQIATDTVPAEKPPGEDAKVAEAIMADPLPKVEALNHLEQQSEKTSDIPPKAEASTPEEKQNLEPSPEAHQAPVIDTPMTSDDHATEKESGVGEDAPNLTSAEVRPPEETQASVNIKDLDFDSMFDDTVGDGDNDEINFDLDFPNHTVNSEALLSDDPLGANISGKGSTIPTLPIEDIDSLLPGLESFANATDDFAMVNIGTTSASADSAVKAIPTSRPAVKGADAPPDLLPPESNFDDMFFGSVDFPMEEGNGGATGDDDFGELGDFDESWFKTDGT